MGRELSRSGQSTVEAALLIPVTLTVVALLVQPACVLYTRSVMSATAHELARVVSTSRGSADEVRAYALRRLAAVPEAPLFHEGGPGRRGARERVGRGAREAASDPRGDCVRAGNGGGRHGGRAGRGELRPAGELDWGEL